MDGCVQCPIVALRLPGPHPESGLRLFGCHFGAACQPRCICLGHGSACRRSENYVALWKRRRKSSAVGAPAHVRPTKTRETVILLKLVITMVLRNESANTQCQAFKDVVDLVTLFPGLREIFLRAQCLYGASSAEAISELWDHDNGAEWGFWKTLAATCLSPSNIAAMVEGGSIPELTTCGEGKLSMIERLLLQYESLGDCTYSNALCVRYLRGILELPGFWLDTGSVHGHVANKLCCGMVLVLKDIGVDIILALDPSDDSELRLDYDGVDRLATTAITGLSSWFSKLARDDWALQPWFASCCEFVRLLRRPRAAELLPRSSAFATTTLEDIVPTIYHDAELYVIVDSENNTANNEPPFHDDDSLTTLHCKSDATSSVHSDHWQNRGTSFASLQKADDDAGSQNFNSIASLEAGRSDSEAGISSSNDERYEPGLQSAGDVNDVRDYRPGPDTGEGTVGAVRNTAPNSTRYPSLEIRKNELEEGKVTLLQRRRDLGDDHPDTLQAMDYLAWTQHELGEFRSARDLRVELLEKWRMLLGEDHQDTMRTMDDLASTYEHLGQFEKAKGLYITLLENRRRLLDEDHPDILLTMGNLGLLHHRQGQFKEAESLQVQVLEKQRKVLGEAHAATLQTMGDLASTYHRLGGLEAARALKVEVVEKRKKVLGDDHPSTLWTMGSLALTYKDLGQLTKAEELQIVVLKKQTEVLGEEHKHPDTVRTTSNLVSTYLKVGSFGAAEELGAVALEKQRKLLGDDHPDTLDTMGHLAFAYATRGQFERAAELYVAALDKWRKLWGNDHPSSVWVMRNLASTYRSLGKLQDAEELERLLSDVEV
ncbi:hypothetical protein GGX14DRAFT_463414 [Mycena pura]|uniref:Kinesin light chain n=1 Tax=Mycena pura TaxID=153505 RepID=A0AAD6YCH2_9AGAR|nr:hypothetical protein GGX14DRAFT_463414 [Mycena pura]